MKLKAKLISTIAAFAMVLCLTIVGVWAATTVNVTVTGTVGYIATDVDATVEGSITGITETGKTYSQTFNSDTVGEPATGSWDLSNITFAKGQDVVITLKVTNNSTERALNAKLVNNGEAAGTNTTAALGTTTEATVAANDSASFTFTIKVGDWNKQASYAISLLLTLTNVAA